MVVIGGAFTWRRLPAQAAKSLYQRTGLWHLHNAIGFLRGRQGCAAHLRRLLLRAGDIERNPGPSYLSPSPPSSAAAVVRLVVVRLVGATVVVGSVHHTETQNIWLAPMGGGGGGATEDHVERGLRCLWTHRSDRLAPPRS